MLIFVFQTVIDTVKYSHSVFLDISYRISHPIQKSFLLFLSSESGFVADAIIASMPLIWVQFITLQRFLCPRAIAIANHSSVFKAAISTTMVT